MRREEFTVSGPVVVDAATGSGDIQFLGGPVNELVVELQGGPEDEYTVELNGNDLIIRPPLKAGGKPRFSRTNVKVYVPEGSTASARTASGGIASLVAVRRLDAATASGNVRIGQGVVEDLKVKTASGDIRAQDVGGDVSITTASGDVTIDTVGGDLTLATASGDLRAHTVEGDLEAKAVSGDVTVRVMSGGSVRTRSVSGDVRLGIPSGRVVDLDLQTLSGDMVNRITKSSVSGERIPLSLSIKTVSGDLRLESAQPQPD